MQLYRTVTTRQDYKTKIKTKTGTVLNHSPATACSFDVWLAGVEGVDSVKWHDP